MVAQRTSPCNREIALQPAANWVPMLSAGVGWPPRSVLWGAGGAGDPEGRLNDLLHNGRGGLLLLGVLMRGAALFGRRRYAMFNLWFQFFSPAILRQFKRSRNSARHQARLPS